MPHPGAGRPAWHCFAPDVLGRAVAQGNLILQVRGQYPAGDGSEDVVHQVLEFVTSANVRRTDANRQHSRWQWLPGWQDGQQVLFGFFEDTRSDAVIGVNDPISSALTLRGTHRIERRL